MKQYCRYCFNLVYGDGAYCTCLKKFMSDDKAKRVNNCKEFELNPIDAFDPNKEYKPRKKKAHNYKQEKLF